MYSTVKHLEYFLVLVTVINNHYCENTLLDVSHLMVHIQCGLKGSIVKLDSIFCVIKFETTRHLIKIFLWYVIFHTNLKYEN